MNIIFRYFFSLRAFFWVAYKAFLTISVSRRVFSSEFTNVHLVLPGGSASKTVKNIVFSGSIMPISDCFLFVNHGVKLSAYVPDDFVKYFFTADSTRAQQICRDCQSFLSSCISIFAPYHLFHLDNFSNFNCFDSYLLPRLSWDLTFGLTTRTFPPSCFRRLSFFPSAYGFGSFCYSLQLAYNFNPQTIYIYGCDFGLSDDNQRYFSNDIPERTDTPYQLIKSHFISVRSLLESSGVNVVLVSS